MGGASVHQQQIQLNTTPFSIVKIEIQVQHGQQSSFLCFQ